MKTQSLNEAFNKNLNEGLGLDMQDIENDSKLKSALSKAAREILSKDKDALKKAKISALTSIEKIIQKYDISVGNYDVSNNEGNRRLFAKILFDKIPTKK